MTSVFLISILLFCEVKKMTREAAKLIRICGEIVHLILMFLKLNWLDNSPISCPWTIKKSECQRIDAFKLWCWRRLLRVPWKTRISSLKPVNSKGHQFWVFFGRTDAEAEAPVLWPPRCEEPKSILLLGYSIAKSILSLE